jgi:hypothetical protein
VGTLRRRGRSRRDFLKQVGAAGAGLVAGNVAVAPSAAQAAGDSPTATSVAHAHAAAAGAPASSTDFGRLFPSLSPFAPADDTVRAALLEVGKPGGIMDAADNLAAGPIPLLVGPGIDGNPTASDQYGTNPDNQTMPTGSTFFGQFIDHDITFDQSSRLGITQDPLTSPNARTPALDLDSVFGGGPGLRPDLYVKNPDGTVGPKLKIGSGGVYEDIPRVPNGDGSYTPLLGDARNDETVMIAGLHCAHILFYNRVLDELTTMDLSPYPAAKNADLSNPNVASLVARQVTLWHYQWLVVNEHLPQIVGDSMTSNVLRFGNRFYLPASGNGFMPIEFGAAAYRFGHSIVRPSYALNFAGGSPALTDPNSLENLFLLTFDPAIGNGITTDRNDLLGGFPAPRRYVGWQGFFDFGDGQLVKNKKIDPKISSVLFDLPLPAIAPHTETAPTVLPQRNLLRQLTWGLPSGQAVATAMGAPPLAAGDLSDIAGVYTPFATSTPLWYYILAEAKAAAKGQHLGPVGGRIVAETLIGLLRADPNSYLSAKPGFKPKLGTDLQLGPNPDTRVRGSRAYTHAHFLYYAQVVQPGLYR